MRPSAIIVTAACLAIVGCTSGPRTYSPSPGDLEIKIDGYYSDGAADRDLQLVVIGNPFPGIAYGAFQHAVEADLQAQAVAGRAATHPTLSPGPTGKPLYRLVYAFGQPNPIYGNVLCQIDPNRPWPVPPAPTVTATAAFCVGGEAETFISGDTPAGGPDDPRFVQLARQMMDNVFRPDFQPRGIPGANTRVP